MKVIAYIRVSTNKQDLQRQRLQIEKYCETNKHELVRLIEEKESGGKNKESRIGLNELLECDETDGDLVVISEMSRFSRESNLVRVVHNIATVLENGLSLVFLDRPTKIYEKGSVLSLEECIILIASAFANAEERKKIVDRMFSRKCQLIEYINPYAYLGGTPAFGFQRIDNPNYNKHISNNKEPKSLICENKEEIEIVKELFKRSANGATYKELAIYFNKVTNKNLKSITVGQILTNPIYIGKRQYRKKIININPVISEKLYYKSISVHKENNKIFDKSYVHTNPLKGIIKCCCGASMVIENIRGKLVYACYKSKKHSEIESLKWCGNYGIKQNLVIDLINYDLNHRKGMNYDKKTEEKILKISNEIDGIKKEIKILNKEEKESILLKEKITNAIINSQIKELTEELNNRYIEVQNTEKTIKKRQDSLSIKLEEENKKLKSLSDKTDIIVDVNDNQYANYLRKYIEKVVYYSNDSMKGYLFIHYKNGYTRGYAIKKGIRGIIIPINLDYYRFNKKEKILYDHENKPVQFREIFSETDMLLEENIRKFIPKTINKE